MTWPPYNSVAGGENTGLARRLPHAQTSGNRHTPSAAPTPSAAVTAVPLTQPHAATGTRDDPPITVNVDHSLGARVQQQQTPTQQTSDQNAASFSTSGASSAQLHVRSHRHQGPMWWGPSAANPLSRSTPARNSHAGSTATTGSLVHAPALLQPAVTQGLGSSATPPRSPLLDRPSPPPAPPHAPPRAAHAPNLNTLSGVRLRAASSDTASNSSQTRARANSPIAVINRSLDPARSSAFPAYLPGSSTSFLASAARRPRPAARRAASPTLPAGRAAPPSLLARPTSRQALPSEQPGVRQETGTILCFLLDLLALCL